MILEAKEQNAVIEDHRSDSEATEQGFETANAAARSYEIEPESSSKAALPKEKSLEQDGTVNYIHGPRLWAISLTICLSLFLSSIEVPIVSTSIVSITDTLHGFDQSGWLVTAYLVTYVGFLMVWASLSEIFGRKTCVISAMFIFVVFSGACGAAQTMTQLIVFRAFQGVGGSGIYTIPFAIAFELVPPTKYPLWGMIISLVFTFSLLLGPIWGGAINDANQWRWVFLFNVPAGVFAAVVWFLALPVGFPNHGEHKRTKPDRKSILRIDYLGVLALLGFTVLLLSALQEAGIEYAWRSAFTITLLVLAGVLFIALLLWERSLASRSSNLQPILPWRLLSTPFVGILGSVFFLGTIFAVTIFLIPQRYIVVNNLSPLQAGLRLIPFTVFSPFGSIVASILAKKKIPLLYIVLAGNCFQVLGLGLLTTLPVTQRIWPPQYAFEILSGFGVGLSLVTLTLMIPPVVGSADKAIGSGVFNQVRYLGGAISLAIIVTVLNNSLSSSLKGLLSPAQISSLLQTNNIIQTFDPAKQEAVRQVFGRTYNVEMRILVCFAAAQFPFVIFMWRQRRLTSA